jgi:hypothetical protein
MFCAAGVPRFSPTDASNDEARVAYFATPCIATARALARCYVQLLRVGGYTVEQAKAEVHRGMCGPQEPGYSITHGSISVPCGSPLGRWSFAELAAQDDLAALQGSLF